MGEKSSIGFIGAGNMAQALMMGILRLGTPSRKIYASDPDRKKLKKVASRFIIHPLSDNQEVVEQCSVVVLATKPQEIKSVLQEIAPEIKDHLLVSIAAGVDTATLSKGLGRKDSKSKAKLIRAMPNNPALIGEGITALYSGSPLSPKEGFSLKACFGAGEVLWVDRERI